MGENAYIKDKIEKRRHHRQHPEHAEALKEFMEHMKARRFQPSSVIKYRDSVMKFLDYLHERNIAGLQDVTYDDIIVYRHSLAERNYSPYSICAYMQQMKAFFNFIEETGRIFDNPSRRLIVSRATLTLGSVLTESQVKKLLAAPDISKPRGLRDRAVLEVLYSTGVRREELMNMTIFDIDLDGRTVRVIGKGRKERILPLGRHAANYVGLYLKNARPKLVPKDRPPTDALWLSRNHRAISKQLPGQVVGRCAAAAGLPPGTSTHTLRRTCATHLLRNGAHPMMVSTLLGHSSLRTLGHYLKISVADMMKAHAKTNPGK